MIIRYSLLIFVVERREWFGTTTVDSSDATGKTTIFAPNDEERTIVGRLMLPIPKLSFIPYPAEVKLHLERAPDKYCLMADNDDMDLKLNISDVRLYVLNLKLNDSLFLKCQEKLNQSSLKYYYDDANITTYSVTVGENCHIIGKTYFCLIFFET